MSPVFLKLDEILAIQSHTSAAKNLARMQFSIGAVEAQFDGAYLHETLFEIAAAYLFYICRTGNKRTALACALAFLRLNNRKVTAKPDDLYELVTGVAEGKVTKAAVAVFFEEHA